MTYAARQHMEVNRPCPLLRIAIVGAGPGGLACAIALNKIPNVQIIIYEQASELREIGAGISINQNTWNVLELLGVADTLVSGHPTLNVLNINGRTGKELSRLEKRPSTARIPMRTQRKRLQDALLAHIPDGSLKLAKKLTALEDLGPEGVMLYFADETASLADLVVGADGIRSVVRDSVWKDYQLKYTGTSVFRVLLPIATLSDLDPIFGNTAWWHGPSAHIYFSPVGEGLWEIAARVSMDPEVHAASKRSWGVPVKNDVVEGYFADFVPEVMEALKKVPQGSWREFAAFAGEPLDDLTNWGDKVVLVGESSHALAGAFGSGAAFAMEDAWTLARALEFTRNDKKHAARIYNDVRMPFYTQIHDYLEDIARKRAMKLQQVEKPTVDDKIRIKVVRSPGQDLRWIYDHDIAKVWEAAVPIPGRCRKSMMPTPMITIDAYNSV